MKRLLLFFLMIGTVLSANAIDFDQLVKLGLPADAKPAKFYFKCFFFNQDEKPSQFDYEDSSLETGDDKFYFFVKPTKIKDEDFTHISLWIYDTQKNAVKEVFNQNDDEKAKLFVYGIEWLLDKQSTFKKHTIVETKQVVEMQEFTFKPVVVMKSEIWTGFNHSIEVVLLLDLESGRVKQLENQRFVAVSHTSTQALMGAEQDLAKDYIITTSTIYDSESVELKPNDELTIYNRQWVTPVINIYDTDGTLISSQQLNKQQIDMIR